MSAHEKQCQVCKYGPDELDWSLTNVALSQIVDCSESSIRRHKTWAEKNGFDTSRRAYEGPVGDSDRPAWVGTSGTPRRAWQTGSGEWRESYQNAVEGEPEEYEWDYETLIASLDGFEYELNEFVGGKPDLFIWADPQLGKAGENGGGSKETIERTFTAHDAFLDRARRNESSVVAIVDLGDGIENMFSTGSQVGTNDLSVPDQVLTHERVTVELIKRSLKAGFRVIHVAVTSNHGEARNAQKNNPYGSENDWGLHIQQVVKDRFSELPSSDVTFIRPEINEDTAVVEFEDGTKVAFAHGHHAGSPSNVVKWVEGQVVGECPGWDATIWILGHFHHSYSYSFGKGKKIFGAPSCDSGSAWVRRKKGVEAQPGVLALTVANGGWSNYSIL